MQARGLDVQDRNDAVRNDEAVQAVFRGERNDDDDDTDVGAIVGGVLGGLAALALLACLVAACIIVPRRRKRESKSPTSSPTDKFGKTDETVVDHHSVRSSEPTQALYAAPGKRGSGRRESGVCSSQASYSLL